MPKTSDILTIAEIDAFTKKLKATVAAAERGEQLADVLAKLDLPLGRPAPKTRPSGKGKPAAKGPAKAAPAKKTRRRTRKPGLALDKVLAGLKGAKDGMAVGALAEKLGEEKDRVGAALQKLRAEKKAALKGEKRNARWFAA